jgi:hypothetical protein
MRRKPKSNKRNKIQVVGSKSKKGEKKAFSEPEGIKM